TLPRARFRPSQCAASGGKCERRLSRRAMGYSALRLSRPGTSRRQRPSNFLWGHRAMKSECDNDEGRLLPLSQLAKRLPAVRGEKPPHRITLYKWATVGLKNLAGQRFRLPTQFIGGTRCV